MFVWPGPPTKLMPSLVTVSCVAVSFCLRSTNPFPASGLPSFGFCAVTVTSVTGTLLLSGAVVLVAPGVVCVGAGAAASVCARTVCPSGEAPARGGLESAPHKAPVPAKHMPRISTVEINNNRVLPFTFPSSFPIYFILTPPFPGAVISQKDHTPFTRLSTFRPVFDPPVCHIEQPSGCAAIGLAHCSPLAFSKDIFRITCTAPASTV